MVQIFLGLLYIHINPLGFNPKSDPALGREPDSILVESYLWLFLVIIDYYFQFNKIIIDK